MHTDVAGGGDMSKAVQWSTLLAAAASTIRDTKCAVLAEDVQRMAEELTCVQSELMLRLKINEAAVEVAGIGDLLQQTVTPEERVDGSASEKEEGGNRDAVEPARVVNAVDVNGNAVVGDKEVPAVPAELSLAAARGVLLQQTDEQVDGFASEKVEGANNEVPLLSAEVLPVMRYDDGDEEEEGEVEKEKEDLEATVLLRGAHLPLLLLHRMILPTLKYEYE